MLNENLNRQFAEGVQESFDVDKLWSKPQCPGVMEPDEVKPWKTDDTYNVAPSYKVLTD